MKQKKNSKDEKALANLIMRADSVICARSTPKQKARIVNFVRKRNKVCLAIGDGANDVNMIRVSKLALNQGSEHRRWTLRTRRTASGPVF